VKAPEVPLLEALRMHEPLMAWGCSWCHRMRNSHMYVPSRRWDTCSSTLQEVQRYLVGISFA
jgi:hypothetical protein